MIEVQGLTKHYGAVLALDNVSFQVAKGEILGFLGPNGAGKTTTMRILTGFMPPSDGVVRVAGYDVFRDSLEARRRTGYMPETTALYNEMSVRGYLHFMASIRGVRQRQSAVDRVVEACGIGDVRDTLIGKLSKGYRQRVGLAQALVHDPEVLVLDEPTIGLDPRQILSVRQLIKSLGGAHTIILSTHILPEASQVCQRVLIINRGRIVAEDTPERLTATLQGGVRVRMQVANPPDDAARQLGAIEGVSTVQALDNSTYDVTCDASRDLRPDLASLAVGRGWGLLELRALTMSLEEIFLQLTTEDSAHAAGEGNDGGGQGG
jgi:ABC-2 type transport system ATP-binding protein